MPAKRHRRRPAAKKAQKEKSDKKLVGYMEERDIAERIHRELKKQGRNTTEILQTAYRSSVDGGSDDAWTAKESVIARKTGLHKETIARMRRAGHLKDEKGDLWQKRGSNYLYDVARTKAFFLGAGAKLAEEFAEKA